MSAIDLEWPDAHVHWQGLIPADDDLALPFDTHMFIFHTTEQLRAAVENDGAVAHSITWGEPDAANVGALVSFSREELHMSLAAHEATHIALAHHSNIETSRVGARRWLYDHPESVAEMTGNLAALMWSLMIEHGGDDD